MEDQKMVTYHGFGRPSAPTGNEGSKSFLADKLIAYIRDPEIRGRAAWANSTGKIVIHNAAGVQGHGPISKSRLVRWVALNVVCWLQSRGIDPGLSVELISLAPGFNVPLDIEMKAAMKGVVSRFRVVVESLPEDSFQISIVSLDDSSKLPTILKSVFKNMPETQWKRIGRVVSY
jgi:hypothetical protein